MSCWWGVCVCGWLVFFIIIIIIILAEDLLTS
jgi:hypothetical protein